MTQAEAQRQTQHDAREPMSSRPARRDPGRHLAADILGDERQRERRHPLAQTLVPGWWRRRAQAGPQSSVQVARSIGRRRPRRNRRGAARRVITWSQTRLRRRGCWRAGAVGPRRRVEYPREEWGLVLGIMVPAVGFSTKSCRKALALFREHNVPTCTAAARTRTRASWSAAASQDPIERLRAPRPALWSPPLAVVNSARRHRRVEGRAFSTRASFAVTRPGPPGFDGCRSRTFAPGAETRGRRLTQR